MFRRANVIFNIDIVFIVVQCVSVRTHAVFTVCVFLVHFALARVLQRSVYIIWVFL
ncbi:hypothetical protein M9458_022096, partial [Cirrhinus mrigala]